MKVFSLFLVLGLGACSSPSPLSEPKATQDTPEFRHTKVPDVLEPIDKPSDEPLGLPAEGYDKVMTLLASLGYQGVGLEHEDKETLEFMEKLFSLPQTHRRAIERVYTGLKLAYDAEQKSFTLGEKVSLDKTLKFIQKNIPKKP